MPADKKSLIFYIKPNLMMEGPSGFEPEVRELQSLALPLGYRPIYMKE